MWSSHSHTRKSNSPSFHFSNWGGRSTYNRLLRPALYFCMEESKTQGLQQSSALFPTNNDSTARFCVTLYLRDGTVQVAACTRKGKVSPQSGSLIAHDWWLEEQNAFRYDRWLIVILPSELNEWCAWSPIFRGPFRSKASILSEFTTPLGEVVMPGKSNDQVIFGEHIMWILAR